MSELTKVRQWGSEAETPKRAVLPAMLNGALGKCPHCGKGHIFQGYLGTRPACEECGEELYHHRADDLPAYLNIFITGHVVVGLMLMIMTMGDLPMWPMTFATAFVALAFAGLVMRPLKGATIGAQWALAMHGFGGHDD